MVDVKPIGRIAPSPRERLARAMQTLLERMDAGTIGELGQSLVGLTPQDLDDALAKMDRMRGAIELASGLARAEVKRRTTDAAKLIALQRTVLEGSELAPVRIRTDTLEDDTIDG